MYDKKETEPLNRDDTFFDQITGLDGRTADEVAQPITTAELLETLAGCADSAPGPDGIPYSIIKGLWPIFGKILVDSWNFTIQTGQLPPSHRDSHLRLIPKIGKDLKKLTNWRPITLSNCDHKLVTKLFSKRIVEKVGKYIEERQTAYVKGRLINDNIRTLLGAIRTSNLEDNIMEKFPTFVHN